MPVWLPSIDHKPGFGTYHVDGLRKIAGTLRYFQRLVERKANTMDTFA